MWRVGIFIGFFVFIASSQSHAYTSIYCADVNARVICYSDRSDLSANDAEERAKRRCSDAQIGCDKAITFQGGCASFNSVVGRRYELSPIGYGQTLEDAKSRGRALCAKEPGGCKIEFAVCDTTALAPESPPQSQTQEADGSPSSTQTPNWDFSALVEHWRMVINSIMWPAYTVLAALIIWILFTLFSSHDDAEVKKRAVIALWIGLPTALSIFNPLWPALSYFYAGGFIWTITFAALALGVLSSPLKDAPALLALPAAVFVLAAIVGCAVYYAFAFGFFPASFDCTGSPQPLTLCSAYRFEPYYVSGIAYLAVFVSGLFLSTNTFIIRLNNAIAQGAAGRWGNSVIDIATRHTDSPADRIEVLFRRSQRLNWLGMVIFGITAEMGMAAKQLTLVQRYRLGGTIVFDSLRRQRQNELAKLHLQLAAQVEMKEADKKPLSQLLAALSAIFKALFFYLRALFSFLLGFMFLRVRLAKLIRGAYVESKDIVLILQAEEAIRASADQLKQYLETAETFDGRQDIYVPE